LRTTSFGSDSRNTFFHAEPTCWTIGPLTEVRPLTAKSVLAHDIYLLERTAPVSDGCAGGRRPRLLPYCASCNSTDALR
jgi:hypothetical protein